MAIEWTQSKADDAELRAVCPFIHAVRDAAGPQLHGRGAAGAQPRPRPFPVMIRLRKMLPAEFQSGDAFYEDAGARERWRRRVKVPALYTQGDMRGRTRIVCTAWVTRWFFEQLAANPALRAAVVRVTPDVPLGSDSLPPFEDDRDGARR